jgi:hypothetical protein
MAGLDLAPVAEMSSRKELARTDDDGRGSGQGQGQGPARGGERGRVGGDTESILRNE